MREIWGEQRKREYEAALALFRAAVTAADQRDGTWAVALAQGETVLALANALEAELSTIDTELADVEATALQVQLEEMRALMAELTGAEQSTRSGERAPPAGPRSESHGTPTSHYLRQRGAGLSDASSHQPSRRDR